MTLHGLIYFEDIPAIVVDATPSTPPPTTRDITSARGDGTARTPEYSSPSPSGYYSPDLSLGESNRTSLQRSRRTSDMSMLSTDLGNKHLSVSSIEYILRYLLTKYVAIGETARYRRMKILIVCFRRCKTPCGEVSLLVSNSAWSLVSVVFADMMLEAAEDEEN